MDFEDQAGTLSRLGLTPNQARVYLILASSAAATASQISKISKLAREEVYRVMAKLQELGLVEVMVETPTKYRACPLSDGVSILLNRKTEEDQRLQKDAENLLKHSIKGKPELTIPEESDSKFSMIRNGMDIQKRKQAIEQTRETLDAVETFSRVAQAQILVKSANKMLRRGVKLRVVIYAERENEQQVKDYLKQFTSSNLEARQCFTKPTAHVALFDDKVTFLATELETDFDKETALMSNNTCLAKVIKDYFERMWRESQKSVIMF
jgi:sugar-specific transcriptional regulator TrmB